MKSKKICAFLMCAVMAFGQISVAQAAVVGEPDGNAVVTDEAAPAADGETTITIYSTNDIHGNVANNEKNSCIGLAQVAGIAESTENSILLDAGDATQGASFATVDAGQSVIQLMNSAGYTAMALGNHEFDYGPEELAANIEAASFPVLSANARVEGSLHHMFVEMAGKNIAVIGLTTTETKPGKFPELEIGDEIEAAKAEIAEVKDEADAIVLLCHMGCREEAVDCTSSQLLEGLSAEERAEVTAVVDGHSHDFEDEEYDGIPIVQGGVYLNNLGKITLHFDGDEVSAEGDVLDYSEAMSYPLTEGGVEAKARVESFLGELNKQQESILKEEICENIAAPLWGFCVYYDYSEPRIVETNFGDFITDAFADAGSDWLEAQGIDPTGLVALENGGGIGNTLPYGTVTRGDILSIFNHGNMVEVLKVTPAQLYAVLEPGLAPITGQDETGALIRGEVSGSFMQCSGMHYDFDPAGASGAKVSRVLVNHATLDRADTTTELYLVTTDYIRKQIFEKNNITPEVVHELGGEDMIVEDFLRKTAEKDGLDIYSKVFDRIGIENDKSPDYYDVDIPVFWTGTDEKVPAETTLRVKIDGGEFQAVTLEEDGVLHVRGLEKGPHSINVMENELKSFEGKPNVVYVNNYSGSGTTVTNRDGYYSKRFEITNSAQTDAQQSKDELLSGFRLAWSGSKLKVSWGKVIKADGYDVFVEKCGSKMNESDLTKTVKKVSKTSVKLDREGTKALSGSGNYKCQVKAYQLTNKGDKKYIASTFVGHIAPRTSRTKTDAKSIVILNGDELTLAAPDENGEGGASDKLNAKITKKVSGRKLLSAAHGPKIQYWSDNSRVATVTKSGKITAKKAGACLIYAFAANGVSDTILVYVK